MIAFRLFLGGALCFLGTTILIGCILYALLSRVGATKILKK